ATSSNKLKQSPGGHTASPFATERTAVATSMAEASFNTKPTIPSRTARRKVSWSASIPIITTLSPGTAARTSVTNRRSDKATAAESDNKTSGATLQTCSTTSGLKAHAPTTLM